MQVRPSITRLRQNRGAGGRQYLGGSGVACMSVISGWARGMEVTSSRRRRRRGIQLITRADHDVHRYRSRAITAVGSRVFVCCRPRLNEKNADRVTLKQFGSQPILLAFERKQLAPYCSWDVRLKDQGHNNVANDPFDVSTCA